MQLYDVSIAPLRRNLRNLQHVLTLGEAFAKQKQIDPTVILHSRLAVDMYPLLKQVQLVSDMSKGVGARLAGLEIPVFADTEDSFAALDTRLCNTEAFLASIAPSQLEGADSKLVTLQIREVALTFTGLAYLEQWAMPNVYFHTTTVYNILRHLGVSLRKSDYLGQTRS